MTEGPIAAQMIRFAVPLFIGNLFQQLYNTADALIVGNLIGSGALAAAEELLRQYGPDSLIGRTAAVMLGSSETTLYVAAVYFSAAGVKDSRWAIPAALCADLACYLSAAWICRRLWG